MITHRSFYSFETEVFKRVIFLPEMSSAKEAMPKTSYLFKAKTQEAYQIKILAELLTNNLKTGCFEVTESGDFGRDHHVT